MLQRDSSFEEMRVYGALDRDRTDDNLRCIASLVYGGHGWSFEIMRDAYLVLLNVSFISPFRALWPKAPLMRFSMHLYAKISGESKRKHCWIWDIDASDFRSQMPVSFVINKGLEVLGKYELQCASEGQSPEHVLDWVGLIARVFEGIGYDGQPRVQGLLIAAKQYHEKKLERDNNMMNGLFSSGIRERSLAWLDVDLVTKMARGEDCVHTMLSEPVEEHYRGVLS